MTGRDNERITSKSVAGHAADEVDDPCQLDVGLAALDGDVESAEGTIELGLLHRAAPYLRPPAELLGRRMNFDSPVAAQLSSDDRGGIENVGHDGELLGGDRRLEPAGQLADGGVSIASSKSCECQGGRHETVEADDAHLFDHRLGAFGVPPSDVVTIAMPLQPGP